MKRIIIALMILTYPIVVCAQQISIHSPTAANLGLYGEMPVSYYTGTPNISIPLYEIKRKQITVPVSLSYHPAGIRPEIHPGPVGLGWSLRAGGVISRTVRGAGPDESTKNNREKIVEGYLYYTSPGSWMAQNNWKDYFKNELGSDCFACRNMVHNMAPCSDFEPDEFSFSVLNISGKFYFDHNGQIQVQCDNPVKVIFNNEFIGPKDKEIDLGYNHYSTLHRAFEYFTIIDEYGTQYHFGGATAIEFSDPVSYGKKIIDGREYGDEATGRLLHATSWFLTRIVTADGTDTIDFEYERGPFVSQLYRSIDYYSYSGARGEGWKYNSIMKDGTLISPVYLKRIIIAGGEQIDLTYSESNDLKYLLNDYNSIFYNDLAMNMYKLLGMTTAIPRFQPEAPTDKYDRIQWLKLDTIQIRNASDPIKQISFVYNNNTSERLFLESLNILYGNNNLLPPMNYMFKYKNRDRLPAKYLTCITDHWGFNNGKGHPSNGFSSNDRSPDKYYTDSGILSEISYPTGGTARFEYELHDYAKVVDTKNRSIVTDKHDTASGLRIKKIITDGVVREFFYKETPASSISSGVLNMIPQYTYTIRGEDCDGNDFIKDVVRSVPVIPLTKDNEGLYIGYTYVCERVSGENNGYIQYHYTNHDNGHSDNLLNEGEWNRDIFPSSPHCSRYFERGRLKKETFINASGQVQAINETFWDRYGSQGEDNPRALLFEGIKIGYDHCSSMAYLHYCYKFLPYKKTETIYTSSTTGVTSETFFKYNNKMLLQEQETKDSNGDIIINKQIYVSDVPDVQNSIYDKMKKVHLIGVPIETLLLRNNKVVAATYNQYAEIASNIFRPERMYLLPNNIDNIEPSDLYPTTVTRTNYVSGSFSLNFRDGYDESYYIYVRGNTPVELDISLKLQESEQTSINEYFHFTIGNANNQVFSIRSTQMLSISCAQQGYRCYQYNGKVKLSPGDYTMRLRYYSEFPGAQGTCDFSYTEGTTTIKDIPHFQPEIDYKYDTYGNVKEIKTASGNIVTTYLWSYKGQYPIAEIRNADLSEVEPVVANIFGVANIDALSSLPFKDSEQASLFNKLYALRNHDSLKNALIITYTYKPLVGMTSMTDPRGVTTYYEYDDFGRLIETYIIEHGSKKILQSYDYHYKP